MTDELLIITMEEWKREILNSEIPVVIEFFTSTCPYCARLTTIFKKLSSEYRERMKFAMVNAAESRDISEGYGIMGVPTLKFLCDGKPIYEIVGLRSEEELKAEIEKVLQNHKKCVSESSPLYA